MNCHEARGLLSGWLDEALTAEERTRLGAHLEQCSDCRRELDRLTQTVSLLQRVERPRAPAGFVDRVLEAARPVPWYRRVLSGLFLPLAVKLPAEAAAVLMVGTLAVYVFQRTPELQQAARQEVSRPAPAAEAPQTFASPPVPPPVFRDTPSTVPEGPRSKAQVDVRPESDSQRQLKTLPAPGEGAKLARPATPPVSEPAPAPSKEQATQEAAGAERRAEFKKEAESGDARKQPAGESMAPPPPPASAPAQSQVAPALEGRADSTREKVKSAPAPMAPLPSAMRALPPADVVGRLAVKDRVAAEHALTELLARVGATITARREEAGATVVNVAVPKAAYAEFSQGLARIGSWLPQGQPSELPTQIRVTLRLTE